MSTFKCKICGGTIEFNPGDTVGICDSCGTKQTLPKLDDDRRANLYDRANHFRRSNDFDKAAGIYEQILNDDKNDSEAYWSLVLCRYGIEYVEDPATHKRVPTVNRAQYTSIFDDEDYKAAIQYADAAQREIYESEAKTINEIQKSILAISQKEDPFDVFICYKETDSSGRRTPDSVLATDLYHQLTQEGFKVFFSRITLEDKLGTAYEPYIFAALNSAKVMVVLGTKPEYFNAVWVKNEWSRYLSLIRSGAKKILIPAYRDMDPYDLPEEFSHLQAQDMSKLGFMQDLIRGISKLVVIPAENSSAPTTNVGGADTLSKRALLFLEDGNRQSAAEYCEKILDIDPENAQAYLIKLMLDMNVQRKEQLGCLQIPFDENGNYQKAIRFASPMQANELRDYAAEVYYKQAVALMSKATTKSEYQTAADTFAKILGYRDASQLNTDCIEKASTARMEEIYTKACALRDKKYIDLSAHIAALTQACELFTSISNYKDSKHQYNVLHEKLPFLSEQLAVKKKKAKKTAIFSTAAVAALAAITLLIIYVILPAVKYNNALKLFESNEFDAAIVSFGNLDDYKDSKDKVIEVTYAKALQALEDGDYTTAIDSFSCIPDHYEDTYQRTLESKYMLAMSYMAEKDYDQAITTLEEITAHDVFRDAAEKLQRCYQEGAQTHYSEKDYATTLEYYNKFKGKDRTSELYRESSYKVGLQCLSRNDYKTAITHFKDSNEYKDSLDQINKAKYGYISAHKSSEDYTTYLYLKDLKAIGYKDSSDIFKTIYAWKATIIANDSETNETKSMSSLSKYSNWYFHIKLTGGEPNASTTLRYTGYFPDGDTSSGKWDGGSWADGYSGTCWFYYNNPAYGRQGTFTIKVMDGSGNVIGEKSVQITS